MHVTGVDNLIELLRRHRLVELPQLNRFLQENGRRFGEPRALAQELLKRDWLTPYQVNQLFLGRGAGLVLGPYLIMQRLGEGGAGQVFKARHQFMRRVVALKIIRGDLLADDDAINRFFREIRLASQLTHPNVVHAYDAGPAGQTFFLAMEYVEGIDLAQLVRKVGRLPVAQACSFVRQAALGLHHAHERGLVHRDVKPSNFLLTGPAPGHKSGLANDAGPTVARAVADTVRSDWGLVKLLDLGLARLQRPVNGEMTNLVTPAGPVMLGTLDYMAPEQAIDFHQTDQRGDIYSLGCTFYYLLTGQPPFAGGSLAQKLLKHQQARPQPLASVRADVPLELERVLLKMLAKRPEERYQSAAEVAQALVRLGGSAATHSGYRSAARNFGQVPRSVGRSLLGFWEAARQLVRGVLKSTGRERKP